MRCQSEVLDPEYIGRVVIVTSIIGVLVEPRHYHVDDGIDISFPVVEYLAGIISSKNAIPMSL
jgi:hypothetical protein